MTDINEWRLEYPGATLNFGTLLSEYPLTAQVDIGDINSTEQDSPHPNSDGEVMGIDSLGGFPLIFSGRILDDKVNPKAWVTPLDLLRAFKAKWRADSLRKVPGAYATLSNLDRSRVVYGRPRQFGQKLTMVRKGTLEFVATFKTIDPNFYDLVEKSATITVNAGTTVGFSSPITAPLTTTGPQVVDSVIDNDGDLETYPIIEFAGPGSGFSLELLDMANQSKWIVKVPGKIKFDQVLRIDTRPWSRSALINEKKPANGMLRGTSIVKVTVPTGQFKFRFRVKSATGEAFAKVYWRDAYASL